MKNEFEYPKYMIRPDDAEIFELNDDGTYSLRLMKTNFPNSLRMKYYYFQLSNLGFYSSNLLIQDMEEPEKSFFRRIEREFLAKQARDLDL